MSEGSMQNSHFSLRKEIGLFQLIVGGDLSNQWTDGLLIGVFSSLEVKEWLHARAEVGRVATKVLASSHV